MAASTEAPFRAAAPADQPDDGGRLPPVLARTRDWRWLLLYLGAPAVIGLYAALNNWVVIQLSGYENSLLFYAGHSFVPWWTSGVLSWACYRLLKPWQPPPVVLLVLGGTLSCILIVPYTNWLTGLFAAGWLAGDQDGTRAAAHIMSQVGFWSFTIRAVVVWTVVNLAFDRVLGLPRYRYGVAQGLQEPSPAATPAAAGLAPAGDTATHAPDGAGTVATAPAQDLHPAGVRLLQRLPVPVSAEDVVALKAEQHYVKVYTSARSFMTLYRFSDAVAEMDPDAGSQVHRSYWVRVTAISRIRRDGRRYELELANGLVVPISTSNRGIVHSLARRAGLPLPPST